MNTSDNIKCSSHFFPQCWIFLTLSVRLNILLHGMTPLYFHIVNVCLHCAVTCLLMHTCERCVFEDSRLAFVTALIFAVHPVHTEAVSTWRPHTVSHWLRKCDRKGAHARVEPLSSTLACGAQYKVTTKKLLPKTRQNKYKHEKWFTFSKSNLKHWPFTKCSIRQK